MKCEKCSQGDTEFLLYTDDGYNAVCLNCYMSSFPVVEAALSLRYSGDIDSDLRKLLQKEQMTPWQYVGLWYNERLLLDIGARQIRKHGGN
jgi:hypothetical protein